MAEQLGDRRVGEVVGRDVDCLDRGHGGAGDRGDALLQLGDLGGKRRLVADPGRQPAEEARDLAARLDEAEHIVHQQEYVAAELVAEIFSDGQRTQAHAPPRTRRLVHLAEDQHGSVENTRLAHLQQQLVPFARALADASEHRDAGVGLDHGANQLHDDHGLADPGATEHGGLAAARDRREQVDHLDPSLEQLARASLLRERRRGSVDRPARHIVGQRWTMIDRFALRIQDPPQHRLADRHAQRLARASHRCATAKPARILQRHRAHAIRIEMALDLDRQTP